MQSCDSRRLRWVRLALALTALHAAGCATPPPAVIVDEPPATVKPQPEPVAAVAQIPIVKKPPPITVEPPVAPPLGPVAIVLASREAAYEDVVTELDKHLKTYSIYDFSDKSQPPVTAFRAINDGDTRTVIAIGLRAAQSAVVLSNHPVIFSQVFNYQDHGLMTLNSRGVAAIPPLDAQLAAWKDVDPTVSEIGLIIGEGHERLIESATIAADRHGVKLTVKVSHSDQETLYFFKRMVTDIDGFWMMPDNRILSARVIREMLADARRRNVAVAVPNDRMLALGGSISFTTSASNIAETIIGVLHQVQSAGVDAAPGLSELSEIRVTVNDAVLQKRVVAAELDNEAEEPE